MHSSRLCGAYNAYYFEYLRTVQGAEFKARLAAQPVTAASGPEYGLSHYTVLQAPASGAREMVVSRKGRTILSRRLQGGSWAATRRRWRRFRRTAASWW